MEHQQACKMELFLCDHSPINGTPHGQGPRRLRARWHNLHCPRPCSERHFCSVAGWTLVISKKLGVFRPSGQSVIRLISLSPHADRCALSRFPSLSTTSSSLSVLFSSCTTAFVPNATLPRVCFTLLGLTVRFCCTSVRFPARVGLTLHAGSCVSGSFRPQMAFEETCLSKDTHTELTCLTAAKVVHDSTRTLLFQNISHFFQGLLPPFS